MVIIATVVVLLLIMILCPVVWVLDARKQQINRQLAIAMPASPTASSTPRYVGSRSKPNGSRSTAW